MSGQFDPFVLIVAGDHDGVHIYDRGDDHFLDDEKYQLVSFQPIDPIDDNSVDVSSANIPAPLRQSSRLDRQRYETGPLPPLPPLPVHISNYDDPIRIEAASPFQTPSVRQYPYKLESPKPDSPFGPSLLSCLKSISAEEEPINPASCQIHHPPDASSGRVIPDKTHISSSRPYSSPDDESVFGGLGKIPEMSLVPKRVKKQVEGKGRTVRTRSGEGEGSGEGGQSIGPVGDAKLQITYSTDNATCDPLWLGGFNVPKDTQALSRNAKQADPSGDCSVTGPEDGKLKAAPTDSFVFESPMCPAVPSDAGEHSTLFANSWPALRPHRTSHLAKLPLSHLIPFSGSGHRSAERLERLIDEMSTELSTPHHAIDLDIMPSPKQSLLAREPAQRSDPRPISLSCPSAPSETPHIPLASGTFTEASHTSPHIVPDDQNKESTQHPDVPQIRISESEDELEDVEKCWKANRVGQQDTGKLCVEQARHGGWSTDTIATAAKEGITVGHHEDDNRPTMVITTFAAVRETLIATTREPAAINDQSHLSVASLGIETEDNQWLLGQKQASVPTPVGDQLGADCVIPFSKVAPEPDDPTGSISTTGLEEVAPCASLLGDSQISEGNGPVGDYEFRVDWQTAAEGSLELIAGDPCLSKSPDMQTLHRQPVPQHIVPVQGSQKDISDSPSPMYSVSIDQLESNMPLCPGRHTISTQACWSDSDKRYKIVQPRQADPIPEQTPEFLRTYRMIKTKARLRSQAQWQE